MQFYIYICNYFQLQKLNSEFQKPNNFNKPLSTKIHLVIRTWFVASTKISRPVLNSPTTTAKKKRTKRSPTCANESTSVGKVTSPLSMSTSQRPPHPQRGQEAITSRLSSWVGRDLANRRLWLIGAGDTKRRTRTTYCLCISSGARRRARRIWIYSEG